MALVTNVTDTSVTLKTETGERIINRTFTCKDVRINNYTFIIVGAAAIESFAEDRIYYPAICRENGNLYHLEFFRSKARRWRLEQPDNIRLIEEY